MADAKAGNDKTLGTTFDLKESAKFACKWLEQLYSSGLDGVAKEAITARSLG